MLNVKPLTMVNRSLLAVAFIFCLIASACSVETKKSDSGEEQGVSIETPVGSMHVGKDSGPQDTGLAVYPGARMKDKKANGEDNHGNISISTSAFGLKVATVEYESDDAPAKIASFYSNELGKYGKPIECHSDEHAGDVNVNEKEGDHSHDPVSCGKSNTGKVLELKVGTEDNQHVVSIEPEGKGTDFTLVYVKLRGKQGSI